MERESNPGTFTQRRHQGVRTNVAPAMKGAATFTYRFNDFEGVPFAHKPVNEVTPADLATYRDQQTARFKPATVVRKLGGDAFRDFLVLFGGASQDGDMKR